MDGVTVTYTMPGGRELSGTYKRPDASEDVPILLLLHQPGTTNNRHDFDDIWEMLRLRGYGLLAPDLTSHGLSDSAGAWQDLLTDPEVWPGDVLAWLDWVESNQETEPITREAVGIIGLGGSGSLAAAAIGKGQVDCVVALSASIEQVNALHPGFPIYVGDDDDSADDGARGGDDDDSAGDDDDSAAGDDDVDADLDLHGIRWMVGTGDEPPASDAQALFDATSGDRDLVEVEGDLHGIEILWFSDETKTAIADWCVDKF